MLDVYKNFYKLAEIPFRLSPDHRFSFGHHSYVEAKAYLEYAIFQGEGFITVTGRPGTGKTTLISEILSGIDTSHILVAMITSTQLDARDLLHMVAASFGLQFGEVNKVTLLLAIEHFLIQQNQKGLRSVLIVDEAQGLSLSALEELRLLANLQHKNQLLLQVCLVGQERLRKVIGAPDMEHFRQRLIAAAHLNSLDLDETITYIEHRLCCAGWRGDPAFTEEALRRIYQASGGIPRKINLICNRMFLHGGLEEKHELDGKDAELMINELQEEMLLAPDEEPESIGADAPGHETDDVVRSLPRGEMLATDESYSQPEQIQQPVEHPVVVKADFSGDVSASVPPEIPSHVQPDDAPEESPPAQAGVVTGDESLPSPEETPGTPRGSRFNALGTTSRVLLVVTLILLMLNVALQQNWFALVKQWHDNRNAVRPVESPVATLPDATIPRETRNTRIPVEGNPGLGQSSSEAKPYRDEGRHDNDAPAILVPEAVTREEVAARVTTDTLKKPGLPVAPVDAAPEIAAQPAVVKQDATMDAPQASVAKKVATADAPPQASVAKKAATADAPRQASVAKKAATMDAPQTSIAKKAATGDAPQASVAKKTAAGDAPPQAAVKAKRPPLKGPPAQQVARLTKSPVQSLPEVKKPAPPAAPQTSAAAASARPSQLPARPRKPAFAADVVKAALLAGRWIRDGQPASVLPSAVTFCSGDQLVINCWSVPQSSDGSDGKVAYKVEATLSNFSDSGNFMLLDRQMAKSIGADATNNEPWQVTERQMTCTMVKLDNVLCKDQQGTTNEYRLSVLSR